MICPSCGAPTPDGARFCPSCGHQLQVQVDERRIVTVLFADLVGFTGLSEKRDPEQVKLLVDDCFEALVEDIRSFGGRVDKIVGDAIVALFGAPVAHEDDPERAVRAALQMQGTLRSRAERLGARLQMRIGVNTGEVLVGALRAGGDYTAMGDVVNTASRLQTAAEPGQVLVGPATHAATTDVIEYEPVGSLEVRGRGVAVEAWRALAPLVPPGYGRRATRAPLVGRDGEMGLIGHALESAVVRRRAALVTLIGEAGVGKSRLAGEVARVASDDHGAVVLQGRCVAYGESNAWWPVAEAVRSGVGASLDDPVATVRSRVVDALTSPDAASLEGDELERVTNGLVHLMGLEGPLRGIDPARAREEVTRAVVRFLEPVLEQRPVMMVIADLHWASGPVFELLAALLERLVDSPFLLLTTARPPFRESWAPPDGRHNTLVVNVDPLARDAARDLLDRLLDGRVDSALREELLDRSGGNPLFLEELVALMSSGGGDLRTGGPQAALPDTLRGLVAARLDGLTRGERRALEDAAVYGRQGTVDALVLMAAADRAGHGKRSAEEVTAAVAGLVDKEILVLNERGDWYTFRSDLVREVAYNTLTKVARALRHYGIGEYLERNFTWGTEVSDGIVDGLAHHYGAAAEVVTDLDGVHGIPTDIVERALRWITEGARRSEAGDMHVVSERLFDRAVSLLSTDASPERVAMLLGRARARAELRHLDDARIDAEAARELSLQLEDRRGHAQALLILGSIEEKEGDLDLAVETLREAEDEFTASGDRAGMAEALRQRGLAELFSGDTEAARRTMAAALDAFAALADRRGQAWALQNLAWLAYLEGRPSEADRRIDESVEMFADIGDSGGWGWATGLRGWVRFHQGHWEEADAIGERILVEAQGRGDRWGEGMMVLLTASTRLWSGRAADAVGRAQEALEMFHALGDVDREVQSAAVLGRALVAIGAVGEGFRTLDLAVEMGRGEVGSAATLGPTAVAAAAVSVGDPERALRAVALVSVDDLDPSVVGESDRLVALGLALAQLGRLDDAVEHLQQAATPSMEEAPSGYALSALACASAVAGHVAEVERLCDEVRSAGRATYLDRVTALLALASCRVGACAPDAAEELFDEAAVLADATDDRVAQALVRLARAEAGDAVGRPDRAARSDATRRLAELGIDAGGWRQVYRGAALAAGAATTGAV
ncbi:adenylate/guanylate cyclase domain-containing protein [Actinomarinicola tropica]|uniref:adenylate/guanylate cyclase domain-containing protein n=1 Tax=Actinomarinicola tropica TaxID=2789776 RepID=UPI0018974C16|nr:adenylate/guanylate cyclase domain-containing protein [Actinomarinicola tropica]